MKKLLSILVLSLFLVSFTGCTNKNTSTVKYSKKDVNYLNEMVQIPTDYLNYYKEFEFNDSTDIFSMSEYAKYFHYILDYETSYTKLTEEEMAAIITFAAGLSSPANTASVKKAAKAYFDLDDFELREGHYKVEGTGDLSNEEWDVKLKDDFYISSILARGIDITKTINFYDVIQNGDEITLKGNLFIENNPNNPSIICKLDTPDKSCIKGFYEYNFIKTGYGFKFKSIKYQSNKDYDSDAQIRIYY